jgi:hypothetical protein
MSATPLLSRLRECADLRIQNDPSVDVRIVERPGLRLGSRDCDALVADLRVVVARCLNGASLDYGVFTGARERLDRSVITVIYRKGTDEPIAFSVLAILPVSLRGRLEDVLHLGLAMVDPGYRGHGLSWALYGLTVMQMFVRRQFRPIWISSVSQVPAVVGLVDIGFSNVFPTISADRRPTLEQLAVAHQLMRHHREAFGVGPDASFDEDRFVIRNAYTGGSDNLKKSFDNATKHRIDGYNDLCRRELDYDRGDDFLQIGQYDLGVVRRYLRRNVRREAVNV